MRKKRSERARWNRRWRRALRPFSRISSLARSCNVPQRLQLMGEPRYSYPQKAQLPVMGLRGLGEEAAMAER